MIPSDSSLTSPSGATVEATLDLLLGEVSFSSTFGVTLALGTEKVVCLELLRCFRHWKGCVPKEFKVQ